MTVTIHVGDCRDTLRSLPDQSVQTCVTSPPYFGLRDYGTASWEGGDPSCDHTIPAGEHDPKRGLGRDASSSHTIRFNRDGCYKCGAKRVDQQIGLEQTPDAFVAELVSVFREVRRVLRDDGTLWLNLGDSYCNSNGYARAQPEYQRQGRNDAPANDRDLSALHAAGLKTKDLIGIPWRVAFALQADGWYLRQDIIWHKPNPMPESVRDRCTKAHEYLFLLSKSPQYYFDSEAIAEPANPESKARYESPFGGAKNVALLESGHSGRPIGMREYSGTRNRRSVWTVGTKPFKGAHFATFPPDLIDPCIRAGSKAGDTVLDPFGGAGTTALVADRLGRHAVLCELNPEYAAIAEARIANDNPLFTEVAI